MTFSNATDASSNLADYKVTACTQSDCTSCTTIISSATSPVTVSLPMVGNYYGCVKATDSFDNESSFQASSSFYRYTLPPDVTTSALVLTDTYYYTTTVTWTAATSADPSLDYELYYSKNPAMDTVADIKANGTSFYSETAVTPTTIKTLEPDTTYYFNIIVSDDTGNEVAYSKEKIKTDTLSRIDIDFQTACSINDAGKAYCWGNGEYCGNGNGDCTTDHETPVAVDTTNFSGKYVQITVNNSLACGLGDNQKIYCWGYGGNSGLGDGSTTNNPIPTEIDDTSIGNPSWRYVRSGQTWYNQTHDNVCGITTNGDAYCWGTNGYGQLGINNTTNHATPQLVLGGKNGAPSLPELSTRVV